MTDDRQNNQDWKDYEELIERYIQVIAKNMNLYGITPSVGRLYGTLYFAEEPMTLDQMRDALLMSKTSMSTGVKALADMKMVTPTFRKGIRKDLYQTEKEAEEAMRQLEKLQEETTDPALKETIQSDIQKLEYSYEYYEWLIRFVRVVETGEIFDYVPRKPKK